MMTTEEINSKLGAIVLKATLPQAIRIVSQYLRDFYPKMSAEELYTKIRFRANPSLAFQKTELSSAELKRNSEGVYAELTLNFLAIFGSSSPLPSHYCELVLESADSDNVLRDFLDIFNHHLQKFVYPVWQKHRYYVQYQEDLKDRFSKYMLSILGLHIECDTGTTELDFQKLMPYAGILTMRQKSVGTLVSILRHYLSHEKIEIEQCVVTKVAIPSFQYSRLGQDNCDLGQSFLMGESVKSRSLKFRIALKSVPWNLLHAYSVHGTKMDELNDLITFSLNEPLDYEVLLHIEKEQIKRCELSHEESACLGVNSCIGLPQGDQEIIFSS